MHIFFFYIYLINYKLVKYIIRKNSTSTKLIGTIGTSGTGTWKRYLKRLLISYLREYSTNNFPCCTSKISIPNLQNPGKNHHFGAILFMKSSEIELDSLVSMNFPFLGERGNDAK